MTKSLKNHLPADFDNPIVGMFSRIAPRYDLINRLMTAGRDQKWRQITIEALLKDLALRQNPRFLDVAAGTGDLALALFHDLKNRQTSQFEIDLLEPSPEMLHLAATKLPPPPENAHFSLHQESMEKLPFKDNTYDGLTIGFGIRNAADRMVALREFYRVLIPGGRLAVLEALPPENTWQRLIQRLYMRIAVPLLAAFLSETSAYHYFGRSVAAFPAAPGFMATLKQVGFENVSFRALTLGATGIFVATKPKHKRA